MVAAVGAVRAFGAAAQDAHPRHRPQASATTLKLMSWFQYEPGRHEAWNTMMAKFNKSQSKYKVVWTGWPANQYEDHVNTQVQAGGIDADVMTLIPDLAARLVKQGGVLEPINSIVKKVGVHPSASHNYIRKGGNLYGISIVEVAFGLLYNKALLAKAGIKRPATDPEQWLAQTVKLTTKPNQFGLYSPNTMAEQFSFWFTLQDWANAYDAKWADRPEAQPHGSEDHQDAHRLEGVLRPDRAAGLERRGVGAPVLERADRAGADRVGRRQHHQDDGPEGLPEPAQRRCAVEERQADLASAPALDRQGHEEHGRRGRVRDVHDASPRTWRSSCAARWTSCRPSPRCSRSRA